MSAKVDLHSHSTASDGALTPRQLVERAQAQGVTHLALTDHDTVAGLEQASATARELGMTLLPGIELSVTWQAHCLHLVGLGIDPDHPALRAGIARLHDIRQQRARKIADKLVKLGFPDLFDEVLLCAGDGMITRTHFARRLYYRGCVRDLQSAFDCYLAQGKPAYVSVEWASLQEALAWIIGSGGVAVLAHPMRYTLTASKMRQFLTAFKSLGGAGIEVVAGRHNPGDIDSAAQFARQFALVASVGSDFHAPDNPWIELGRLAPLPPGLTPAWHAWL